VSNPCVIIEISDIEQWAGAFGGGKKLPMDGRPTILQPDRETAEAEAKRLAKLHFGKHFCVLEAQVVAKAIDLPSHITVSGNVWNTRREAVLLTVDDEEVPF
jgi:hypothetical protein